MPYTPPEPQSPVASRTTSPSVSRSSSYTEEPPRSPSISRPTPPRSHSSTSYLHKHRRSPSISNTSDGAPPTPTDVGDPAVESTDFASNASVRQSPPPVNNLAMPTGAVLSPPDSPDTSDGETPGSERGRELQKNWDELQLAVRGINQRREGSPEKADKSYQHQTSQTESEPHSQITSPTALSSEARKIAHSRSSTENAIIIPKTSFDNEVSNQTTDESDEDDPMSKPALVRKKSGELVKPALRPSSRRRYSSMPGTPTYSKSVHFNDSDNQTRHFLQVDKPIAVSAGSSPVETYDSESEFPFEGDGKPERGIKLANFPADTFEHRTKPVRVERIFLSQDKQTLIGVVAVQNLSFQKLVAARFTVDYWKTTSEVVAEYNNDPRNPSTDGCDRFNFHIKLSDQTNIDNKTLLLCVRYNVGGAEYWDNNNSTNYQVDFTTQKPKKSSKSAALPVSSLGQRPLSAIPRSRHNPSSGSSSRGRRESIDDDFAARLDAGSAYNFGPAENLLGESNSSIKLKPRAKRGSLFEINTDAPPATQPPANGLGGRYDFGASLSAALSTAQDKLGRQSGLMPNAQKSAAAAGGAGAGGSYFGPVERNEGPMKADERPDDLTTGRPAMGSDQYRDLVQKFCYVGSSANRTPPSPAAAKV